MQTAVHEGLSSLLGPPSVPFSFRIIEKSTHLQGIACRLIDVLEAVRAKVYPTEITRDDDQHIVDLLRSNA